ncbi:MAG TPA: GntR family transcriptional regulator [Candidatus Binatia bacterium]|nr:GntR family transcriptional regulator [Candidatus Binatia bacterium]
MSVQDRRPARAAIDREPTPIRPLRPARTLPVYLQIEEELAERIEAGELAPGSRLPTERELSESLGVSRMTVRAALARLVQRGLITRHQGSGTFVAQPKLRQDTSHLRSFFEASLGQGLVPASRLIERAEILATRHLAQELDLRVGEPVYKVVRVRSVAGVPVVLETSFFPARLVPGLLDLDLEGSSIYRLMEQHYAARPVRARQALEPIVAGALEADLLGVALGSPLMLVERTAWDARGRAVEHARDLYRGDRSRFIGELTL